MQVYVDKRQVLPSYSFILHICVEGSGNEANHVRNIFKTAMIIARGEEIFNILFLDIHFVLL